MMHIVLELLLKLADIRSIEGMISSRETKTTNEINVMRNRTKIIIAVAIAAQIAATHYWGAGIVG